MEVCGSIQLAGSFASTGEPLNWNSLLSGIGYNEVNFAGNGVHGGATALVTALSASGGTITATAANNFSAGYNITFSGCTTTLGLLLNGLTFTILTATSSNFTFTCASTGAGSGETGMALCGTYDIIPEPANGATLSATITALAYSGGIITVTAANTFLPGAQVTFVFSGTGTLGTKINGLTATVLSSTSTAFTFASALTGSTASGSCTGINPVEPFSCQFWSASGSGYSYATGQTTGVLYVQQVPASSALSSAAPMVNIPATTYPANVLSDVIHYWAVFARG
jgi:hypothetical protein